MPFTAPPVLTRWPDDVEFDEFGNPILPPFESPQGTPQFFAPPPVLPAFPVEDDVWSGDARPGAGLSSPPIPPEVPPPPPAGRLGGHPVEDDEQSTQVDRYGLNALAGRLAPAPQGPVAPSLPSPNVMLDRASAGAESTRAAVAAIPTYSPRFSPDDLMGLTMESSTIGSDLSKLGPAYESYEAGAGPIGRTVAGVFNVATQIKDPEVTKAFVDAALATADGDLAAGVRLALEAYDKYSIPFATGVVEMTLGRPQEAVLPLPPVGKLFRGAKALDAAIAELGGPAKAAGRGLRAFENVPVGLSVEDVSKLKIGDWFVSDDGIARGKIIGEGTLGKNIPAWTYETGPGRTSAIPKDQAKLWWTAEDAAGDGLGGMADALPQPTGTSVPPPSPTDAAVLKLRAGKPNAAAAERQLRALEKQGVDVTDARDALDEYKGHERGDYDSAEDYQEARQEAYDSFLETLEGADTGVPEAPSVLEMPPKRSAAQQLADEQDVLARQLAAGNDAAAEFTRRRIAALPPAEISPPEPPLPPRPPADLPGPDTPGRTSPSVKPNVIGLRPISTGLTRRDQIANAFKETLGVGTPAESHATPAFRERARVQPIIDSQSATVSAQADEAVRGAFPRDAQGRIGNLANDAFPNGPTIQDAAARLPQFWDRMTPAQRQTMQWLQETIAPYRQLWDEVGARDIGSRTDVMDGGFYLPRGRADLEGVDEAVKVYAGPTRRGKAGFEKQTVFDSMAQGIDAGYEYHPLRDSIRSYVKDAGTRIADQHVANYLKAATDDAGNALASTVADRLDPRLRSAVQTLRAKIAGRSETLLRRTIQAKYAHLDAERQAKAVTEELERALKARERAEFLRQTKWAGSTDKEIWQAEADLKALQQGTMRQGGRTDIRIGAMLGAQERLSDTAAELKGFQSEFEGLRGRWKVAQEKARQTPRGMGQVGLVELQGTSFPDELANAFNKELAAEGPSSGTLSWMPQSIAAFNSLVRGLRSTGEMSMLGIQGALGMAKDQRAYGKAMSVALRAWGNEGDRLLGMYLQEANARWLAEGLPDSTAWTRNGTHVGGADTEFTLGEGIAGKAGDMLKNAPVIRQANRGFGYFGDALRSEWSANELRTVMRRTGKSWQQLEAEGEMQRIAEAVNRATGWTNDRAAGDLGELVMFAPRFFQSRLETLGKGVQGLRPNAPIDQAIARDSLVKLIGGAAILTYTVNELRGEKTDWRPWIYDNNGNARRNPNFFRIRNVGGRDWSLLGTWDSLFAVMIDTAIGHPARALRTMAAPAVSVVWDVVSGRDFLGKPTRDTPVHFAEWLARSHVPFFATGLGDVGKAVGEGEYAQAGGVSAALFVGAKGSPLSYSDVRQNIAQAKYGKPWEELTAPQRYEVEKASELEHRQKEFPPRDTGSPEQHISAMFERRDVQLNALVGDLRKAIDRGDTGKDLAAGIKNYRMLKYQVNSDFLTPEVLAEMERTKSKTPTDMLADEYWNFEIEKQDGELDYDGREKHRIRVLEKAKAQGIAAKDVTFRKPIDDKVVQAKLEAYDADMETLKPYYAVRDAEQRRQPAYAIAKTEIEKRGGIIATEAYIKTLPFTIPTHPEVQRLRQVLSVYRTVEKNIDVERLKLRETNKALNDAGIRWGKWKPLPPKPANPSGFIFPTPRPAPKLPPIPVGAGR